MWLRWYVLALGLQWLRLALAEVGNVIAVAEVDPR
jgi:hypothetical protein